jgi:hypothetical protein
VVDTVVAQADWNLDPMDGTGPSGVTLDATKSQILVIDKDWLGVGARRVGLNIHGVTYYVHAFFHANLSTGVYMTTANLPVRWSITNTGAVAAGASLKAICCSVISEGGFEDVRGLPFTAATANVGVGSISTTEIPLIAIRPAATFNSIVNRTSIRLQEIAAWAAEAPVAVRVYYNPTVTGGTWAAVGATSAVEVNTTATFTGGTETALIFVPTAQAVKQTAAGVQSLVSQLPFTLDAAGANPITIGLTAVRIGPSGTATVGAELSWREYR